MPSDITAELIHQLTQRDEAGLAKYGTTLDRTDLTTDDWIQHTVEELLDAAGYLLALRNSISSARSTPHSERRPLFGANDEVSVSGCWVFTKTSDHSTQHIRLQSHEEAVLYATNRIKQYGGKLVTHGG